MAKTPGNGRAHDSLGAVLAMIGRFDDAIAQYQQALTIEPDDAEVHNNFGAALEGWERLEAAIAEYDKALKVDPDNARPTAISA